jgi:hypothetical protein
MGHIFRAILLAGIFCLGAHAKGFAEEYPRVPGIYLKLADGTYKWLPQIAGKHEASRLSSIARAPRQSGVNPLAAKISIGDILLAPTIDPSAIDHIMINTRDEKLRFVFSVAFTDEYSPEREGIVSGGSLIVTRWGFSDNNFDTDYAENGSKLYRAKHSRSYFTSFTYPRAGAGRGKIIDVGRALATDTGIYLFNTTGSLSNLLWNIRLKQRQAAIPEMANLLRKLEHNASKYNEWGTVAWIYKDFGNTTKAVEIYRDKVIPQTIGLKENERRVWQQYFEEIKK